MTSGCCITCKGSTRQPKRCSLELPKPGDALKALSMVPRQRRVHYLDLEHPEFGINPLLANGDAAMVADKVVEAISTAAKTGQIGDGKIFVTPIDGAMRIRTGETDANAL